MKIHGFYKKAKGAKTPPWIKDCYIVIMILIWGEFYFYFYFFAVK